MATCFKKNKLRGLSLLDFEQSHNHEDSRYWHKHPLNRTTEQKRVSKNRHPLIQSFAFQKRYQSNLFWGRKETIFNKCAMLTRKLGTPDFKNELGGLPHTMQGN